MTGIAPFFAACLIFFMWYNSLKTSLIDQSELLSHVVIQLDSDEYNVGDSGVKKMKNKLISCLTIQLLTLRNKLFVDIWQLDEKSIEEAIDIVNSYWSVPPIPYK